MDIQHTHKKLLELAIAFDQVCRAHNLVYTLHGGSLLGAIREKGFIPWDDDLDVAMTRQEYEKLCSALKGNENFHIVGNIKKQFRAVGNNSIWVDIFICDYISEKAIPQKAKQFLLTVLDIMNRDKHTIALSDFARYSKVKQILFKSCYWCGKLLTTSAKAKLHHKVAKYYFTGNKTIYVRSNDQLRGRNILCPIDWMEGTQYVPFASSQLAVSSHYHQLLVSFYGEDYMIPKQDTRNAQVHNMVRAEGDINL